MRARAALFRQLREFFETQTTGIFNTGDVAYYVARPAEERTERGRRFAFGKEREIVEGKFGDYEIMIGSSLEFPPLGRVTLRWPEGEVDGPMDIVTFERAGAAVRARGLNQRSERKIAS